MSNLMKQGTWQVCRMHQVAAVVLAHPVVVKSAVVLAHPVAVKSAVAN